MKELASIFVMLAALIGGVVAHAETSAKNLRLRMFAERRGDLYLMDTKSIVMTPAGRAGVTVYAVKSGYSPERQQLSEACCGMIVSTRAAEGTPVYFEFACDGSSAYTIDHSAPFYAAALSVAYNMSQFACAGARCKANGMACSE
jgi:hypothetical protein